MDLISKPLDQKPRADAKERVEEIQKIHEQVKVRIGKFDIPYQA